MKTKSCVGECPKCGSVNLSFGPSDSTDEARIFPFTCDKCGCEGREVYDLVYGETQWER